MQGFAVGFFLNFLPLDVAERASNILVDKHFSDLLPKGAGNFEGQTQVGVKSALFNAVDGLARHTHLGGQLCL
jgi:hypothetical protein